MRKVLTFIFIISCLWGNSQKQSSDGGGLLLSAGIKKTNDLKRDGLTYDQFGGETVSGSRLAEGWRRDTVNGGYNKTVYDNPYLVTLDRDQLVKQGQDNDYDYFLYKNGKKYSGEIADTITSHFDNKVMIFRATCVDGMVQGKATLSFMDNDQIIAFAFFENGEMVGECMNLDVKTNTSIMVKYPKGSDQFCTAVKPAKEAKN
jgi:hypothetical protein